MTAYRLDIEPPNKSVFVTQLNERGEDEVNTYPVVDQSADRLIETGIRSLQRTLVVKRQVALEAVDGELVEKRKEFRERMAACDVKRAEIRARKEKLAERMEKFQKFIDDNESKRRRAIQKYQAEMKGKLQKGQDVERFRDELEIVMERRQNYARRIQRYKKYAMFLQRVIKEIPENYIEAVDTSDFAVIEALLKRHTTLSENKLSLEERLDELSDELERIRFELKDGKDRHDRQVMTINKEVAEKTIRGEKQAGVSKKFLEEFMESKNIHRAQTSEMGEILMAIDNLAEKCTKENEMPMQELTLRERLDRISDYITEKIAVVGEAAGGSRKKH